MMNMKYLLAGFSCAALLALAPTSVGFMDVPQVYAADVLGADDLYVEFNLDQQNMKVTSGVDTKIYVSFPTVKDGKVKDGKWASYDNDGDEVDIDLSSKKVSKEFYVQIKGNKSATRVYHLTAAPGKLKAVVDNVTGTVTLQSDKKDLLEGTGIQYSTTNGNWKFYDGESLSKYQENGATLRFRVAPKAENVEDGLKEKRTKAYLAIKTNEDGDAVDVEGSVTTDPSKYVVKEVTSGIYYDKSGTHYEEASSADMQSGKYVLKTVLTQVKNMVDAKKADTNLKDSQNKDLATYEVLDTFASDEVKAKIGKRPAGPKITANYKNHTITVTKGNYRVYQGTTKVIESVENAASKITITLDNKIAEDKGFLKDEVNTGNDTYITEAGAVEAWLSADTSKKKARSAYTELAYDAVEQLATKAGATSATDNYVGKLEDGETTPKEQVTATATLIETGKNKGKYDVTVKNGTQNKYEIVVAKEKPAADAKTNTVNPAGGEKKVKAQERSAHIWVRLAADTKQKIWSSDFVDMGKLIGLPAPKAEIVADDCTETALALTLTDDAKVDIVDVGGGKDFSYSNGKISKTGLAEKDSVIFKVSIEDDGDTAKTIYKATCKTVDSEGKKSTWEIKEIKQSEVDELIIAEKVQPDNTNASKASLAIVCPKDATIKECKEGYVYDLNDGKCTFTKNSDDEFTNEETFNFTVTLGDAEKTFTAKVVIDESGAVTLNLLQ